MYFVHAGFTTNRLHQVVNEHVEEGKIKHARVDEQGRKVGRRGRENSG